ncbi:MAG: hypothetical protein OXI01_14715 [Albidovulum sp.]|nr:hypothetical protein [Albidovulum sp.]
MQDLIVGEIHCKPATLGFVRNAEYVRRWLDGKGCRGFTEDQHASADLNRASGGERMALATRKAAKLPITLFGLYGCRQNGAGRASAFGLQLPRLTRAPIAKSTTIKASRPHGLPSIHRPCRMPRLTGNRFCNQVISEMKQNVGSF